MRGNDHQVRVFHAPPRKKPLAERLFGMPARSWKTFEPLCRKISTFWHLSNTCWQESIRRRAGGKHCRSQCRRERRGLYVLVVMVFFSAVAMGLPIRDGKDRETHWMQGNTI